MKLSKKQEKAIGTALYALEVALSNGLDEEEEKLFSEAVEELAKIRDKSLLTKAKEKAKKEYIRGLLENSNTITLDAKWYDENIRHQ